MMSRPFAFANAFRRIAAPVATAFILVACAPAPDGPPLLAPAPTSGLVAVSAGGASSVRILYVRGGSIVLMRTVFLPPGEHVRALAWSPDERDAVIETSGGVLALDTRTWRLAPIVRLAAARDDARAAARD
jgi:hypothetical protein